jgi:hypothetical protein
MTNLPVSSHGPVQREQREQELEYFLNKQYNDLGLCIKTKLVQMRIENPIMSSKSQMEQLLQQEVEQLSQNTEK